MKSKILLNQNDTVFFMTHFLNDGKEFPLSDESYFLWSRERKASYVKNMCGGERSVEQNQNLIQMLLLHDEIIFPYGVLDNVSLSYINKYFKTTVMDSLKYMDEYDLNFYKYDNQFKVEDKTFVYYMKPAIINTLVEELCPKYYIQKSDISDREFASIMIDFAFGLIKIDDIFNSNLIKNVKLFVDREYKPYYIDNPRDGIEMIEAYISELCNDIYGIFYRLLWETKLSNDNDCIIYNSYYDVQYLGIDEKVYNSEPEKAIYRNIRININDKIRQLPHMISFEELLRVKERHKKDIKRLRQVITELEQRVLNDGETYLTDQINRDIEQAVNELNKSETLSKVSSIATYAAVPIGIAETILAVFPVVGISVGIIGAATTAISKHFTNQNNWINVVR